jgi:hypothetical protein
MYGSFFFFAFTLRTVECVAEHIKENEASKRASKKKKKKERKKGIDAAADDVRRALAGLTHNNIVLLQSSTFFFSLLASHQDSTRIHTYATQLKILLLFSACRLNE